jgi:hypothetical protein
MSELVPMWLLIDDTRDLGCSVIARNADAAKVILKGCGRSFEAVCIDHDLGDGESGYDVLKWAIEAEVLPNHVQLVTQNPSWTKEHGGNS